MSGSSDWDWVIAFGGLNDGGGDRPKMLEGDVGESALCVSSARWNGMVIEESASRRVVRIERRMGEPHPVGGVAC